MAFYIARRLVWTLVVVACVLAITFAVFFLLPAGDPALRFAGKNPTRRGARADPSPARPRPALLPAVRQLHVALLHRRQVRLARPRLHLRERQLGEVADRGARTAHAAPHHGRSDHLARHRRRDRRALGGQDGDRSTDRLAMGFALFGISTPVFWLGLMALYIFWRQARLGRRHRLRLAVPTASPASSRT